MLSVDYEFVDYASLSYVTRTKNARKKGSREILRARRVLLAVFFRVTRDGLSERGTTRSARFQQRGLLGEEDTGKDTMERCPTNQSFLFSCLVVYVNCIFHTK